MTGKAFEMHPTAFKNCQLFFKKYARAFDGVPNVRIIEIGSQDVNGSLRSTAPPAFEYMGVDFVKGRGVDVVLDDPYSLPFDDESADIVISSSCFEHSQMFWLVFLEVMRVLKPAGIFYLNAPSNGAFHRYPVDCWRFYPDSGGALVTWARRNHIRAALLESYVSNQEGDIWNDFVGIFLKDERYLENFPMRVLSDFKDYRNGFIHGSTEFLQPAAMPEDMVKLETIQKISNNELKCL